MRADRRGHLLLSHADFRSVVQLCAAVVDAALEWIYQRIGCPRPFASITAPLACYVLRDMGHRALEYGVILGMLRAERRRTTCSQRRWAGSCQWTVEARVSPAIMRMSLKKYQFEACRGFIDCQASWPGKGAAIILA